MAKRKKLLYLITTKDKYELPMIVADSIPEMARITGMSTGSLHSSFSHHIKGYHKVLVEED